MIRRSSLHDRSLSSVESDLVLLIQEGFGKGPATWDAGAARRVYEAVRYQAVILSRRWNLAGYLDPDDATQQWFVTWIGKGSKAYRHYRPLYPVAYVILFHLCASYARKARAAELNRDPSGVQGDCPVTNAHRRDLVERTRQAIERLPRKHKLAVHLRYYDGVDSVEAARLLGVSAGRLHGLTHEARRMLLTHLSEAGVTAADL